MARSSPRLAAGVGVLSVFLLLGGSGAAVAFADPGGSRGSDRGSASDRGDDGRGGSRGGGKDDDRRGSDGPRSAREGSDDASKSGSSDGPRTRVGSGREDIARLSPGADADSGGGSGAVSPGATSVFEPPKVTIGNGRAPGIQRDDPEPRWRAPSPQPAEPPAPPPPPPPPVQAPSLVDRIATPPTVVRQFVVAPAAELTEPLWGVAGLLLIPAAGAALGYRQARAAQAAERQNRFSGRS
ncbi:hypothetical protein ABGB19_02505 [Mycobacterium sp. B14F4]|uniref:hypothetical protein n=1 Tax=Mycobacterium sp. B14F4 TaxID=3153565 RepID=UPI00325D0B01